MVLRDGREPLIQQVLKAVVIGLDDEATAPQVRPPMPHGVNEPNELAFVRRQSAMPWSHLPAEKSHRMSFLNKNSTKPVRGGITFNDK